VIWCILWLFVLLMFFVLIFYCVAVYCRFFVYLIGGSGLNVGFVSALCYMDCEGCFS